MTRSPAKLGLAIGLLAAACTPPSRELPLHGTGGGSGESSGGGCGDDQVVWVDNTVGDNAAAGTMDAPVADLEAALARVDACRIHVVATTQGYTGACIVRDDVTVLGVGGRPRIDTPVVCDDRLVGLLVRASRVHLEHLEVDLSAHAGVEARAVAFSGTPQAPITEVAAVDVVARGPGAAGPGRALMSSSLCFGCRVEGCVVEGAEQAGIGFENHQDDVAIVGNTVTGAGESCIVVNGEPAMAIPGDATVDGVSVGVTVTDNVARGCGDGPALHLASVRDARVAGNVVADAPTGGLLLDDDGVDQPEFACSDVLLAHNTIDCRGCERAAVRVRAGAGNRMVDGVVFGAAIAVDLEGDGLAADHNAYDPDATFVRDGVPLDLTQWRTGGLDDGSLAGDPSTWFVDLDAGDLHPIAGAAIVDAGVDVGIERDADGAPRLAGAAVDLGAYELPAP